MTVDGQHVTELTVDKEMRKDACSLRALEHVPLMHLIAHSREKPETRNPP